MSGTGTASPLLAVRAVEGFVPAVIKTGVRGLVLESAAAFGKYNFARPAGSEG